MLSKFLYRYSARLPCRLIHSDDERYLERYYLGRLFSMTFYLHRFVGSDGDRALHDHPWKICAAICLAGGYREKRLRWFNPEQGFDCVEKDVKPGRLNYIPAASFHQILHSRPETWTLFFHTPKFKGWGFLNAIEKKQPDNATTIQTWYEGDKDTLSHNRWWETVPKGKDCDRAAYIKNAL